MMIDGVHETTTIVADVIVGPDLLDRVIDPATDVTGHGQEPDATAAGLVDPKGGRGPPRALDPRRAVTEADLAHVTTAVTGVALGLAIGETVFAPTGEIAVAHAAARGAVHGLATIAETAAVLT